MGPTQRLHSGRGGGRRFHRGLRYGDGTLYTKDAGDLRVFWQGPTIGVDLGADGARTMMLVYNLSRTDAIYEQFNGIAGAAYFVAGLGMTALTSPDEKMIVVPIRTGLGLRLGYNVGYLVHGGSDLESILKSTWNAAECQSVPLPKRGQPQCPRVSISGGVANVAPKATPLASVPRAVSTTITTATMTATRVKASAYNIPTQ
jgi:hypothetical protein